MVGREGVQSGEQVIAEAGGARDQAVTFDDLEDAPGADHVGQVAAPGRVDP